MNRSTSHYSLRSLLFMCYWCLLFIACFLTSSCGQKGALYIPTQSDTSQATQQQNTPREKPQIHTQLPAHTQ